MPLPDFCDLPGMGDTAGCQAVDAIGAAVDFGQDPMGYIAGKMQEAAAGLANTVLPAMAELTHPDMSLDWFRSVYEVSFALSLFAFVVFLGWNFVQLGRRRVSGDEVVETLVFYAPLFLGGVLFGPMFGQGLLSLTGALTDSLIGWGISGSSQETTATLLAVIAAAGPSVIAGGAVVAIIFLTCVILALLLAFVALLVMLVTLYMSGALLPLSLVWLVHPRQRSKGQAVVMVWMGICFSHVLLFLMLGLAFKMITGLATSFDDPGLQVMANLAVAAIVLLMATLSPFGLLRFAPVGPSSAGSGPSLSMPRMSRSGGGSRYKESPTNSQTAQMAADNAGSTTEPEPGSGTSGSSEAGDSGPRPGGLMSKLAASQEQQSGGSGGSGGSVGSVGSVGSGASSTAGQGNSSPSEGAAAGDAGVSAESAGDKASSAGAKLTAAGTAAEATGVGAPAGAALQAAGTALNVAGTAASTTARMAQAGGDMAAEHMGHADQGPASPTSSTSAPPAARPNPTKDA